ncbi:unnamed protein product [Periconia digitata]|uniref:Uncharacterized protein n=1 Tax=Periconia digitata TaxID=1303443 RepID=A0A9W4XQU9_9PLEO|nr:unnamed protein product [Periconia digitata]
MTITLSEISSSHIGGDRHTSSSLVLFFLLAIFIIAIVVAAFPIVAIFPVIAVFFITVLPILISLIVFVVAIVIVIVIVIIIIIILIFFLILFVVLVVFSIILVVLIFVLAVLQLSIFCIRKSLVAAPIRLRSSPNGYRAWPFWCFRDRSRIWIPPSTLGKRAGKWKGTHESDNSNGEAHIDDNRL